MAKKSAQTRVTMDARPIAAIAVCAALAAGTWFQFTSKQMANAESAAADRTTAESVLSGREAQLASLRQGGPTQAQRMLRRAKTLDELLPARVESTRLVGDVAALAAQHGVKLDQLNPTTGGGAAAATPPPAPADPAAAAAPAAPAPVVTAARFEGTVSGAAGNITAFVKDLTSSPQLMTITAVKLTGNAGDGSGGATATFTLLAWSHAAPELGEPGEPRS